MLDLDYPEDSAAATDMNVVMNDAFRFVEVQGTAEDRSFSEDELQQMLGLAKEGIGRLFELQRAALQL